MSSDSISTKLQELFDLFNSGALSQEEYNQLKSELLTSVIIPSAKSKESIVQLSSQNEVKNQPNLQNEVRKEIFEDKLEADPLNTNGQIPDATVGDQNNGTEIEKLDDARSRKKTRKRVIAIVSAVILAIAIAASIYAYQYFGEQKALEAAKQENTIDSLAFSIGLRTYTDIIIYIREHPNSDYSQKFEKQLPNFMYKQGMKENSFKILEAFLIYFPTDSRIPLVNSKLETMYYKELYESFSYSHSGLFDFNERFPNSKYNDSIKRFEDYEILIKDYPYRQINKSQEDNLVSAYPDLFNRTGNILSLKLDNGKFKRFYSDGYSFDEPSTIDNASAIESALDDFIMEISTYLIVHGYWEWGDYELIDKATGFSIHVSGKPIVSPTNKRIVILQEEGYFDEGIAIYRVDSKYKYVEEFNELGYRINNLKWINDNEFIGNYFIQESEGEFIPFGSVKFIFDGTWKKVISP